MTRNTKLNFLLGVLLLIGYAVLIVLAVAPAAVAGMDMKHGQIYDNAVILEKTSKFVVIARRDYEFLIALYCAEIVATTVNRRSRKYIVELKVCKHNLSTGIPATTAYSS